MFQLHERLAGDTAAVCTLGLCRVLLMDNRLWPWLILAPERPGVTEVHHLSPADRARLIEEVAQASEVLEEMFGPDKINVGALGNIVPQLHVHVIARSTTDRAWPGPVWGAGHAERYDPAERDALADKLRARLLTGSDP